MIIATATLALLSCIGHLSLGKSPDGAHLAYMLATAPIRALAIRAEALGAKDSLLLRPQTFVSEWRQLSKRLRHTTELPSISATTQFSKQEITNGWVLARVRLQRLLSLSPRPSLSEVEDARFILDVYELLYDGLLLGEYRVYERRLMLKRAKEMIGEKDFYAGKLPRTATPAR